MRQKMLLKLADYLENNVEDKNFCLSVFGRESACGTVACAWGSAPQCFPRARLRLVADNFMGTVFYTNSKGERFEDFEAAVEFFKLHSYEEALHLFNPTDYPLGRRTRSDVAERIRDFVRNHKEQVRRK